MNKILKDFNDNGYVVGVLKQNGVIFSDFKHKLNDFNSGPNFVAMQAENNQTSFKR